MFEFRDPKTGMVLILNVSAQSDNERDQIEQFIFELGKMLAAISTMTPPIRRVLYHALQSELQAFSQAQALNIVDLVKVPDPKEPVLDMRIWGQYKGPSL